MKVPRFQHTSPVILAGLLIIMASLLVAAGCTQQASSTTASTQVQVLATSAAPAAATMPQSAASPVVPVSTTLQTPAPGNQTMITFTESDNGATKQVATTSPFAIQLGANPTTGFSWNATASPGLEILSSDYKENSHPEGMVGVGGVQTWVLETNDSGTYTFTAIYKQPWMPTTGNETVYNLTLNAVQG
jgi:inhibitor of cysteine peptidase